MAFTPLPGVNAYVEISSTKYAFDSIKFQPKSKMVEATNFTSAVGTTPATIFEVFVPTVAGGKVILSGPWDGGNMAAFSVGASVTVILGWSATLSTSCPAYIEEINVEDKVDDIARVEVTLQLSGVFTASLL